MRGSWLLALVMIWYRVRLERVQMWVAWRVPRWLFRWVVIRAYTEALHDKRVVAAHVRGDPRVQGSATTGPHGDTSPNDTSPDEVTFTMLYERNGL